VLEILCKCVEECRLIALTTADNIKDTRPSDFSNDQLNVLKTYPILDPDQPCIPVTDKQQKSILVQNINIAQERIRIMENRANDSYYHILVTGDINSGKSAFINGLLRRDILPSGPMPLTSTFIEILDARDIGGKEEAHLCRKGINYDCKDTSSFNRENIGDLYDIMYNWNGKQYDAIEIYVNYPNVHTSIFNYNEHKVHIIDSVGLNTSVDATRFLSKKQQKIDVLIFVVDARYGLTESSTNFMKSYCKERTKIFVVITHLDCICRCKGTCSRACREVCKQRIMNAVREISPETFTLADELIHCVNPTLVPLRDDGSGNVVENMPQEWANMELCLHTFICGQFNFHKLSPIVNYLRMLMHDVILFAQLNTVTVAQEIDKATRKIRRLQDSIGQLEDKHDIAYIKAKNKIDETKSDVRDYILWKLIDLKVSPEKLVSKEMISGINLKKSETELQGLLKEKWKEFKKELNQKIEEYIQNCKKYIDQLVEGLPNSSTHADFIKVKRILQDIDFDVSKIRDPRKSLKSRVKEAAKDAFSSFEEASMKAWKSIVYQIPIDMISKHSEKDHKLITGGDEKTGMLPDEKQENGTSTGDSDEKQERR
jgi:GTP-binding protein EngB required for normal cell division